MKKIAALTLAAVLLFGAAGQTVSAGGNAITLFRIYPDSTHTISQLEGQGIDIWQVQPQFVEAPLTSAQIDWLQQNGWDYKMSRQTNGPSFEAGYHTYASMRAILADRAKKYRDLAQVVTIGFSYEGQPIQAIKITNAKTGTAKPKSLWIGGTHAREIAPPEVMLSNIDYLLQNYGTDADVTWMLDTREVWIVPVVNPDGHKKAEQLLNWRKNTNTTWGSDGVDLNRNYDEKPPGVWGTYGTSSNPFSSVYPGPRAFSEPETQAIRNLVQSVMGPNGTPETVENGFNLLVDMHSFGNLIMWPWNWTKDAAAYGAAGDIAKMEQIGNKWATYNTYKAQIGAKLYATAGDTTDWAYGFHKIPSFCLEIAKSFWPSDAELPGLKSELRGPFLNGVKTQDDPYGRAGGPDATELSARVQNGLITVQGTADDTVSGKQRITAAEVFIGKLGERGTGVQAQIGTTTNAGSLTQFSAQLSAAGLPKGKQLLIVEAQDTTGAWGAPSAIWVTIP